MIDDDELRIRRREAELEALKVGLEMIRSDATPATAKASVIRAFLTDAVQRRGDENVEVDPFSMSASQLTAAIHAQKVRLLAFDAAAHEANALDAEFEEIAPAGGDVFG